jgi:hypothetical protein
VVNADNDEQIPPLVIEDPAVAVVPPVQPVQPLPVKNAFQMVNPQLWPNNIEFDIEKLRVEVRNVPPPTSLPSEGHLYMTYDGDRRRQTPIIKMAAPMQVVAVEGTGQFCNITLCPHGGVYDRRADGTELRLTRNEQRDQLQTFFETMERTLKSDVEEILMDDNVNFYGIFSHSRRATDFGWRLKVSANTKDEPLRTRFKVKGEDGVYREISPFTDLQSLIGQTVILAVRFHRLRYKQTTPRTVSFQAYAWEVKILGAATESVDDSDNESTIHVEGDEEYEEPVDDVNPY